MAEKKDYLFKFDTDREINDIAGVLRLDPKVIAAVSARGRDALIVGGLVIVLSGLANFLGSMFFGSGLVGIVAHLTIAVIGVLGFLFFVILLHYIAEKLMGGKAPILSFAKPMAYAFAVTWVNLIYFLQFFSTIWFFIITFTILKTVHQLDTGRAVVSIILALLALGVITVFLGVGTLSEGL
ncbi:MAG: hypothetical protein A2788_01085 [Candidatus Abawacabacteria bacterium RIFCSPHIGHO2_01_FULL_46_8]|uniref:Yip1 domain-containing protein n=1 Tax=Candidatus Abawacabacteria bacterium RIFCSPHIGHO2_01_FULL_46_8 TaxID=1817815 RepID=A0A1F4XJ96_9BACT|nr:MAG: hypothetical protein A2788_01085 [Candidatus Abawacabacteria bacterium RIFCSPHIGHO2_01_FULL_46_8]